MGFLGLDDEIAHAELFDEGHDLLLRSGSDGEHGDDSGNAKNHAEHGQKRAKLVAGEVFKTEDHIRQPLLQ